MAVVQKWRLIRVCFGKNCGLHRNQSGANRLKIHPKTYAVFAGVSEVV